MAENHRWRTVAIKFDGTITDNGWRTGRDPEDRVLANPLDIKERWVILVDAPTLRVGRWTGPASPLLNEYMFHFHESLLMPET